MRSQPEAHPLMRDSDLIEHRAVGNETKSFVERSGVCLRVKMDPLKSSVRRFLDEPPQEPLSHPISPVGGEHCEAANLTERVKPPRANCVTVRRPRQRVNADGVHGIPFFTLRDSLFVYEDHAPDAHEMRAVALPGGRLDRAVVG
jgi:hypothetical protein